MSEQVSTLDEAKKLLQQQHEVLSSILDASILVGITIKKLTNNRWLISLDGSTQVVSFDPTLSDQLKPAQSVLILKNETSIAITQILQEKIHPGNISKVSEILPDGMIIIESKGEKHKVFSGLTEGIKEGDDVFVYGNILITDIHKAGKSAETVEATGVTWDDIGGLEKEKLQMRELIEYPIEHKELYAGYGQKTPKGVLLYGPPGNGKTMLGKALATSISKFYGTNVNSFFYIKGPELLSQYVGVAEQSIRDLFSTTRAFYAEHGYPAVIFIDEAEAILSRRGSGKSSDIEKTIVPQFLTEMDGIGASNTIVVLASNRPDMIDSAILREGRIDKKIRIDNPSIETAKAIVSINLQRTTKGDDNDLIESTMIEEIFSDKYPLYHILSEDEKQIVMKLSDITSGATLANIVNSTISHAIRRDIQSSVKTATGIKCEDALMAVRNLYEQHKGYKHPELIEHFAEVHDIKIKKVIKVK